MRLVSFFALLDLVTVARSQTVPGFPAPVAFNPSILGPAASPAVLGPAAGSLPSFFGPATTPTILSPAIAPAVLGPAAGSLPSILSPDVGSLPSILSPDVGSLPSILGPATANVPSLYSPASIPSLLSPTQPTDVSIECIDDFANYTTCVFANLGCLDSCASVGTEENSTSDTPTCDNIEQTCQDITCCAPCLSIGKRYLECESRTRGCSQDCSNIAPVAPSPVPPTSPSTQDFCMELALSWTACLFNNADSCEGSNCTTVENPDATFCNDISSLCTGLTCCTACSNEGRALGACYSDIFQCDSDCGSFSPIAPSVINITLPPALYFPPSIMIPTMTTTAAPASTPPVVTSTSAPAAPSTDATTAAPVSEAPVVPTTSSGNSTKAPTSVNGTKAPTSSVNQSFITSSSVAVLVSVMSAIAMQSFLFY